MTPVSLRTRLTILYTTIFFICLGGLALLTYKLLANALNAALDDELVAITTGLRGYLNFSDGQVSLTFDEDDPEEAYFVRSATRFYQVYNVATGEMLSQSPDLELLGLKYTPEELQGVIQGPVIHEVTTDQGTLRFINNLIMTPDGSTYLLEVGGATRGVDDTLRQYLDLLLWVMPLTLLVSAAAARWIAGQALKPLRAMAALSEAINVKDLGARLPLRHSGDELDQFASSFNQTLSRLQHSIEEMRQFTGSIAHELRTPLTAMRGEAELALMNAQSVDDYRRILGSQLEEFEKLTRMINELLTLARAEAGEITLKTAPVNLGSLVTDVVESLEPIAASKDVRVKTVVTPEVIVNGDAGWLERAVVNLVDNAVKFTPTGGEITVIVDRNGGPSLIVRDTGVGISPDAIPHIFERFYQQDASRSGGGAGLGLSLVHWIVEQHKGTISVDSRLGEGAAFRIVFPHA